MAIPLFNVEKVTLIDTSWLVYRSLFAHQAKSISAFTGIPAAGPTVMFYNSIMKVFKDFTNPIFVLDGFPVKKHEIYPLYKAQRKEARDEDPEGEQKKQTRNAIRNSLVQTLPSVIAYIPDQEADDTIASLATQLSAKNVDVSVISSDRDLWQLHSNKIKLHIPSDVGYKEVDDAILDEAFGCPAVKIALVKTWLGDGGDNVPKIPRIPSKLINTMVNACETLEDTLAYVNNLPAGEKWKPKLIEFIPQARINYELVKAQTNLDVGFAYFRLDSTYLQSILEAFQVRNLNAYEIYQLMIPAQDAIVTLLAKHDMLKKVYAFEEVYRK